MKRNLIGGLALRGATRRVFLVGLFLICFFACAKQANATSATFDLIGTNTAQLSCTSITPCVQVNLNVNAAGTEATFTVSSLLSGWVIDKFGFDAESGSPLTVVPLTLGTTSGEVSSPSLNGSGNEDGWGTFDYNFHTGENGGSNGGDCTVSGGIPGSGCTFTFTVNGTDLSLSDFEIDTTGGNGSGFFADHMASANNSGYAGDSVPVSPVPEPATLTLFGSGLFGLAAVLRKRLALFS